MITFRIVLVLVLALTAAAPAAAYDLKVAGRDVDVEPNASCMVTSVDGPGSGVQPFVDAAALGARVGTPLASATAAAYPYQCTSVVLQLADPDQRAPRNPLVESLLPGEARPVYDLLLP